ncbi:MAG: H-NS histone family protein [Roseovarius sp.]|nr:H-NS histone family protein [Roseovarius sp.]MCY4316310.1 H-NS histone family protein [Roseovarius sp.]
MANPDLKNMSLAQLKKLSRDVNKAIEKYEDKHRKDTISAIRKLAKEKGYELSDLMDGPQGETARNRGKPKYQDPNNPENTWSGVGRRPSWIKGNPEDYMIHN